MMQVDTRDTIIAFVDAAYKAAFPNTPIVYDNQPFDRNSTSQWVEFEISMEWGEQIGMSVNPKTRYFGWLYITVHSVESTGSRTGQQILDWFAEHLGYTRPGRVRFRAPRPDGSITVNGWYLQKLKLDFHADES